MRGSWDNMNRHHSGEGYTTAPAWERVSITGLVVTLALSLILTVLLIRVLQLQIRPEGPVLDMLASQTSDNSVTARRGSILDRHERIIASSRVAHRLFVDPALIVDRNTFSEHVGYGLGYEPAWVEQRIAARSSSRYVVLDPRLDHDRLEGYRQLNLPGLAIESYVVRDYPQGPLAGQLLGFTGRDGYGLEGLERQYDAALLEGRGQVTYMRDPRRRIMWADFASYRPQQHGRTIRLSIDLTIQSIAERHLAETVTEFAAASGQMVVMSPQTGEILAMANWPAFDPNQSGRSTADQRRNRAVTDVFEPGSIFKPIVWSGLLDAGVVHPDERFDCTTDGVYRSPQGRVLRDAHGLGRLSWDEVLIKSSNIGMAIGAQRVSIEQLHDIVRRFGFGSETGSGLPGEVGGIVNPLKRWNHYSQTSIPMGQEIAVTAIQMTRAFCTIANDGLMLQPTILYVADDPCGEYLIQERVISTATARHCREVLRRVVTEGTGRHAASTRYSLFGKTGTAQLPDLKNGGYLDGQYVSSFIAGGPTHRPVLVIGCFIHRPDKSKGYYGGIVAAPCVKQTMEESLLYLGLPPDLK